MIAAYVVLGALALFALTNVGMTMVKGRSSTERYNRALGVLGTIRERRETYRQDDLPTRELSGRASFVPTEQQERAPLVFVDDALVSGTSEHLRSPLKRSAWRRSRWSTPVSRILVAALAVACGVGIGIAASRARTSVPPPKSQQRHKASETTTSLPTSTVANALTPTIDSLAPSKGRAGATLTISGSGFMSANGAIVATFNGHPAPTRCPTEHQCFVTIPTGSHSSIVRVRTQSGLSNALTFRYG